MNSAVLLVDCPDAKGLVASISRFLFEHGANILDAAEHRDNERGRFFMRVEFDIDGFDVAHAAFAPAFQPLVDRFGIDYRLDTRRIARRRQSSSPATSTAWSICCTGTAPASCVATCR